MYAVVGCTDCGGLWVLADPRAQETATCPTCGRRHRTGKLRRLFEAEKREAARAARSRLLAERADESAAFESVPSGAALEEAATDAGVGEDEYLSRRGADPDEVAAAGERAARGRGSTGGDRASVVREAIAALDEPTAAAVADYAADRGVPADAARDLLERLRRRGEATVADGEYRLL
ncbi:MAG: DUF5817 domain-containing protein [Haloferacaceae archaeon]